ncbi:DUF742 domain-containing protein [Nocardia sp. NPDC004860]|uniref:DUF742 domain-containing protein n=1 Tax=Nocardia sp. NPDC004860 TaxID=3154557 RepID=UPI0033B1FC2E
MSDWHRPQFDDDGGPLVRLFAVAGGRTSDADGPRLDIITLVVAARGRAHLLRRAEPEYAEIMHACRTPQSVAEVAAAVGLPLSVTKVLISDLLADELVIRSAPSESAANSAADVELLRRLRRGIRAL